MYVYVIDQSRIYCHLHLMWKKNKIHFSNLFLGVLIRFISTTTTTTIIHCIHSFIHKNSKKKKNSSFILFAFIYICYEHEQITHRIQNTDHHIWIHEFEWPRKKNHAIRIFFWQQLCRHLFIFIYSEEFTILQDVILKMKQQKN